MGIEDILRANDEKRQRDRGSAQNAIERGERARAALAEHVLKTLLASLVALNDRALGQFTRLPIASKPSETPIYIECDGLVRLTLHCVVRADNNGIAYCSTIDLGMSRGGKIVRGALEPMRGATAIRANRLGVPEKLFAVEVPKLRKAVEALAHQL